MPRPFVTELETLLHQQPLDLARLALGIARVEAPRLDEGSTLAELVRIGGLARSAVSATGSASVRVRLSALNRVLFDEEGFSPNTDRYDDVRNHLIDVVVRSRTGIPITLAVVYITVARLAGIEVFGVSFPGHFLLRVPRDAGDDGHDALVLDPFDRARELSRDELAALWLRHAGEEARWHDDVLAPATSRQIVLRMLTNLKRIYVGMRSFRQAWQVADALVTLDGRDAELVRDRGLLAYHLDDFAGALADLEEYVQISGVAREGTDERGQIWDHVSSLRRRVASLN